MTHGTPTLFVFRQPGRIYDIAGNRLWLLIDGRWMHATDYRRDE